ncbi:MAG: hypothetical protein HY077_10495 [Elusimicrobia bacterium]|nr:hypothetical protein [Elusimicrobiota bacterium]
MISSKHLGELLTFKTPMAAVVSLYLETSDRRYLGALGALKKQAGERDPAQSLCQEDLARISRYVETEFEPEGLRGVAVFSSKRFGLWRACPLPLPVKSKLLIDSRPHLAPLLSMSDQHHRFGVVLSGPRRTRFLEVFMGQIKEYEEIEVRAADSDGEHLYLKDVSDRLDGLARNQGFQRVVVGVGAEDSSKLVNHLHTSLQHNLILDAGLDPESPAPSVLQRVRACESQARQVRESVLAHRLIDAAKTSPRLAVLGLERTLDALAKGQVRVMLARDGYTKMGRRCPGCGRLSLNWPKCLDCGRPTETVFDLVGEMIDRALEGNCEVFRLCHETPLDNLGRIGAELTCDPPEGPAEKAVRIVLGREIGAAR